MQAVVTEPNFAGEPHFSQAGPHIFGQAGVIQRTLVSPAHANPIPLDEIIESWMKPIPTVGFPQPIVGFHT